MKARPTSPTSEMIEYVRCFWEYHFRGNSSKSGNNCLDLACNPVFRYTFPSYHQRKTLQIKTVLEFSAASLTAFLVACFSPTHQEGLGCSDDGLCPSGLACASDQICRSPDGFVDGGFVDGGFVDGGVLDDASPGIPDAALFDGGNDSCDIGDDSICATGPVQTEIVISTDSEVLDTDTDSRCRTFTTAEGAVVCLIYTDSFTVQGGSVLNVVGSKPLFVASIGSITIDGRVDVSSSRNGLRGAGSNSSQCPPPLIPAANGVSSGGGGAGGSFQGKGGNGGFGDVGGGIDTFGAIASTPEGLPDKLRGGCEGSSGGTGDNSFIPSEPGAGGGAIAFLSTISFTVSSTGSLFANGSGAGRGIQERGGGAGGGSGGMLTMTAPSVVLQGLVLAEGGGGGGGASTFQDGADGNNSTKESSGAGGLGASIGDDGEEGNGGEGSTTASRGQHSGIEGIDGDGARRGGGGGGGGAGYLIVKGTMFQLGSSSPGFTIVSSSL